MSTDDANSSEKKTSTKDPTLSVSEFQDDLDTAVPEKLLGEKSLVKRNTEGVLVRIESGVLELRQAEKMGIEPYKPPHKGLQPFPALVVGPFPIQRVEDWARGGVLSHTDYILKPYDRWKIIITFFPDLAPQVNTQSLSDGSALTLSQTDTLPEGRFEEEKTHTPTGDLKLTPQTEDEGTRFGGLAVDPEKESQPAVPAASANVQSPRQTPEPLPQQADFKVGEKISLGNQESFFSKFFLENYLWLIAAGLMGGVFWKRAEIKNHFFSKPEAQNSSAPSVSPSLPKDSLALEAAESVPEIPLELRPIEGGIDFEDSDPLVRKIRPILENYQKGITILTDSDEILLTGFSQAGTSSWEARRLASNQLAVFLLSNQLVKEGLAVLEPIYEAVPGDATTLLNLSLLSFVRRDFASAEKTVEAAQRTAPLELKWIAHVISGKIKASVKGAFSEATKNSYEEALRFSANNFFIWGSWLRSATINEGIGRASKEALTKLPRLMRAGLWSDPDRLRDSPIPAPIAGHIVEAEAIAGFQRAVELTSKPLIIRNSQRPYIRWLETRKNRNPVSQDLSEAAQSLSQDNDVQAQVLLAYTLKEMKKITEAVQIMQQAIPLIETEKDVPVSSWPWTLAGDLHAERGDWDQAATYYEGAIKKNPNDVAALWGLSTYFREKSRFVEAIQKKQEALSLDPNFIPARLRISRFEWHRRLGH
jgi:tetratricopeptide (TPR) repeat protein